MNVGVFQRCLQDEGRRVHQCAPSAGRGVPGGLGHITLCENMGYDATSQIGLVFRLCRRAVGEVGFATEYTRRARPSAMSSSRARSSWRITRSSTSYIYIYMCMNIHEYARTCTTMHIYIYIVLPLLLGNTAVSHSYTDVFACQAVAMASIHETLTQMQVIPAELPIWSLSR